MKRRSGLKTLLKRIKKQKSLRDMERKFRCAYQQIVLLNGQLVDLKKRYFRAKKDNLLSLRYSLRLRLSVAEGVRSVYYDYAKMKAERIAHLRMELLGEQVNIASGSDSDDTED